MELFVAQSYSKNLGLYSERIGAMNVVCSSADAATRYSKPLCFARNQTSILPKYLYNKTHTAQFAM